MKQHNQNNDKTFITFSTQGANEVNFTVTGKDLKKLKFEEL